MSKFSSIKALLKSPSLKIATNSPFLSTNKTFPSFPCVIEFIAIFKLTMLNGIGYMYN